MHTGPSVKGTVAEDDLLTEIKLSRYLHPAPSQGIPGDTLVEQGRKLNRVKPESVIEGLNEGLLLKVS
jgi:hypothetical protein